MSNRPTPPPGHPSPHDRYGTDVLAGDWRGPRVAVARAVPAERGLVVEDAQSGFCGAVVAVETAGGLTVVHLEDRHGRRRGFPLGPGFHCEGAPVTLTRPAPEHAHALAAARAAATRTASGSRALPDAPARVARASRILVEGRHDAELVEKVWGADLRVEGVVVELLGGIDDLDAVLRDWAPTANRRLGVLVDHLVPGSKEDRIVARCRALQPYAAYVCILGHPYVDVWQAIRPQRLGLTRWPQIPVEQPWKEGILAHLGWPHATQADVATGWRRILATVRTYADLEPSLCGAIEQLIDFVTDPVEEPARGVGDGR
ncbi:MAG: DUF3097 domain-containing protein [Austwickia sp.]|nr:DUF3097 domain-containing protein [Austwickia sp.]MBK8435119.1 DUF3097 domain-containing protein [Austwickia sp.]MBK9101328.1 DUF3097 domain-containing protein [Austwickia sp.]